MAHDPTEQIRKAQLVSINAGNPNREKLEARWGQVWDTKELGQDFDVLGFMAPYVVVRRKSDNKEGSLQFTHHPRFYFNFKEDKS